jgi:hypothetical protein
MTSKDRAIAAASRATTAALRAERLAPHTWPAAEAYQLSGQAHRDAICAAEHSVRNPLAAEHCARRAEDAADAAEKIAQQLAQEAAS